MGARLVLILGGTAEAAGLAAALADRPSWWTVTSLAGRTSEPRPVAGELRQGGFGGVAGLTAWLAAERPAAVVDATHPFARQMPWHAAEACAALGIPRLRLLRPSWQRAGEDRWVEVADAAEAVRILPNFGKTALLTTGQEEVKLFLQLHQRMRLVLRSIEPIPDLPLGVVHVQARPPFTLETESVLLARYGVDVLVSKAAGGAAGQAKILAARARDIPVVLLARPPQPEGPCCGGVAGALAWLAQQGS
ncbi:cobalt-precorrin-6A reductase [Geminicoccus flavidas]|uniref:cobalt-precorrin-6A reductase n=1 Tax=Geminicoccus flavidas TaxID=2506407 RepID=UPI001358F22B|nr:cobalt-precorrin-6A reductase [Geminicoccus flavidas]